ncbi:hypothetical protein RJT34_14214 [Clitoria ternatea]|uniref:Plastocyanin-like domain-containing protein n=1 Tax=Clitoria ternatea TaxID=43366 RepID=A0AAN9JS29_CLITE
MLDNGHNHPFPHGLVINGHGWNGTTFSVDQGKTYRFKISNVGLTKPINFRIQGHKMKLVEQRYAVNNVSYVVPYTPSKLADNFNIPGVFFVGSIPATPAKFKARLKISVMGANFHDSGDCVPKLGKLCNLGILMAILSLLLGKLITNVTS